MINNYAAFQVSYLVLGVLGSGLSLNDPLLHLSQLKWKKETAFQNDSKNKSVPTSILVQLWFDLTFFTATNHQPLSTNANSLIDASVMPQRKWHAAVNTHHISFQRVVIFQGKPTQTSTYVHTYVLPMFLCLRSAFAIKPKKLQRPANSKHTQRIYYIPP